MEQQHTHDLCSLCMVTNFSEKRNRELTLLEGAGQERNLTFAFRVLYEAFCRGRKRSKTFSVENLCRMCSEPRLCHSSPAWLLNGNGSNQARAPPLLIKKRREEGRELLALYLQHSTLTFLFSFLFFSFFFGDLLPKCSINNSCCFPTTGQPAAPWRIPQWLSDNSGSNSGLLSVTICRERQAAARSLCRSVPDTVVTSAGTPCHSLHPPPTATCHFSAGDLPSCAPEEQLCVNGAW